MGPSVGTNSATLLPWPPSLPPSPPPTSIPLHPKPHARHRLCVTPTSNTVCASVEFQVALPPTCTCSSTADPPVAFVRVKRRRPTAPTKATARVSAATASADASATTVMA